MNETTKEDDYFQAGSFHQVDNICKDSNSHFSYPAGLHITNESIKIHEELTFPQFLLVLMEVNNTSLHHLCRDLHELSCPVIERSFKLTGSFSSASDLSLGGECFGSVDGEGCSSVIDDDTLKSFPMSFVLSNIISRYLPCSSISNCNFLWICGKGYVKIMTLDRISLDNNHKMSVRCTKLSLCTGSGDRTTRFYGPALPRTLQKCCLTPVGSSKNVQLLKDPTCTQRHF